MLHFEFIELAVIATKKGISDVRPKTGGEYARRANMLLQPLRLRLLVFKLLAEETNLGLRLFSSPFRLRALLLLPLPRFLLFRTERLQIATKHLRVFSDAFQLRLERSNGPGNICLFHHHPVLFLFCSLELVSLT